MVRQFEDGDTGRPRPVRNVPPRGLLVGCVLGWGLAAGVSGCMTDEQIIQLARERGKGGVARAPGAEQDVGPAPAGEGVARADAPGGRDAPGSPATKAPPGAGEIEKVPEEKAPKAFSFACSYWKDADGNGLTDYPAEFVGIGNRFSRTAKVSLCLEASIARPYERTFKLLDGSGSVVFDETKKLQASPAGRISLLQFNPGYLKPGSYEAVWSIDGKDVGSTRFEIVEE